MRWVRGWLWWWGRESSLDDTLCLKNCKLFSVHGVGERPALGRRWGYGDEAEMVPMAFLQGTSRWDDPGDSGKEYLNSPSVQRNTGPFQLHLEHTFTCTEFKCPDSASLWLWLTDFQREKCSKQVKMTVRNWSLWWPWSRFYHYVQCLS